MSKRRADLRRKAQSEHARFAAARTGYSAAFAWAWQGGPRHLPRAERGLLLLALAGPLDATGSNPPDNRPAGSSAAE